MKKYDVVVVGGGPGGYIAAEHAAKYGKSVAIIENKDLGGTCLNRGCIPSKTMLRNAEIIELIDKAKAWGIETENVKISFEKMMIRKTKVINSLKRGVELLLRNTNVDIYYGEGSVTSDNCLTIESKQGTKTIYGHKIILATGSKPFIPPIKGLDEVAIHTSDTIFNIDYIPESMVIIGGGFIGVEFAFIFSSLNVDITIVEMENRLIPNEDRDAANLILKKLSRNKHVTVLNSSKVKSVMENGHKKIVQIEKQNGEIIEVNATEVLVASGRKPNLSGLEKLHLEMNGPFISVNNQMETSIPTIYAVGDVIGGWQLAHVASAEGMVAATNAVNDYKTIDYSVIPRCIYTIPEIASVGISEQEAIKQGFKVRTEIYQLGANGKAFAMDEREGFIKIIADEKYDEILGMVMVGPHVTEMISEASAFISLEGTVNELASLIHPHPTLSEGLPEVAKSWLEKKTINMFKAATME